jgi:hypothetical protein
MTDDLDPGLGRMLVDRARDAVVPPVDAARLVRRGRRRRLERRIWTAGAAVATAVVVALVTGAVPTGGLLPGDTGQRQQQAAHHRTHSQVAVASNGATGPRAVAGPRALFVTRTHTYVDGRTSSVRLPWDTGAHVGRLGVAYPQPGTGARPMLLGRDGRTRPLAAASPALAGARYDRWVAADSDSGLVAWSEIRKDVADIVAFDTSTMTEVSRERVRCDVQGNETGCPRPYVADGGLVFLDRGSRATAWNPRTGSQVDLGALPSQAHRRVLTTFDDAGGDTASVLGRGWQQAHSPRGIEGLLSYDGGWILDANGDPTAVNWRDPSQTIRYRPPGAVEAAEFDTDGSVLVVTVTGGGTGDGGRAGASSAGSQQQSYTGWDCALGGKCAVVVPPQHAEIRLVAWDT